MKYVLSVDQSTQGTKALLFDEVGRLICRRDVAHEQKINGSGWVSHDPEEIYRNTLESVRLVLSDSGIDPVGVMALGISNQRETSLCWRRDTGKPIADAIVWQCGRAKELCQRVIDAGWSEAVHDCWDSQLSYPAVRLGNFLPAYWLGLVLSLPYRFQKFFPVFSQPGQRLPNGHSVNPRRSLVGLDPLVGSVQVVPAQNPFMQIRTVLFRCFLTANTLRSRIPFVFRTISLRAAQVSLMFCVLHVDLLL